MRATHSGDGCGPNWPMCEGTLVFPGTGERAQLIEFSHRAISGFALIVATRIRTMQGFHLVMNLALLPLFFLSGAFFPLDNLPTWLRVLGLANPLTYPVDLMQTAAYAASNHGFLGPAIDFAVLGTLALALFALGLRRSPRAT